MLTKSYTTGEVHLFRGNESILRIEKSVKPYARFYDGIIMLGLEKTDNPVTVRRLLYKGYKKEALKILPELMNKSSQGT